MAIINNDGFEEGDVPTAARLNAPYDALASSDVDPENTKPNWATRYHFNRNAPNKFANELLMDEYTGIAKFVTTSTSYVTVSNAGNPAEIVANKAVNDDAVLRFQTSGIIAEPIVNDDGDGTDAEASYNCMGFRLLMTYSVGGGSLTEVVAECGYSYNRRSRLTNDSTGLDAALWYRSFSFSGIFPVTQPNFVFQKVELQVKAGPNGGANNAVSIERNNIILVIAEH
jgi:hypothetical protein